MYAKIKLQFNNNKKQIPLPVEHFLKTNKRECSKSVHKWQSNRVTYIPKKNIQTNQKHPLLSRLKSNITIKHSNHGNK